MNDQDDLIPRDSAIALIEEKQKELCPLGKFSRHAVYGSDRDRFDAWQEIIDDIDAIPAATPPERTGRWIEKKEWRFGRWVVWFECSECGEHDDKSEMYDMMPFCTLSNYCPNCGAHMVEGDEHEI